MNMDNYTGKLVRLAVVDLENDLKTLTAWDSDSEYGRLQNSEPVLLFTLKSVQEFLEKEIGEMFMFGIRRVEDDRLIGMLNLSGVNWTSGNAWVGIGIGEREEWGKGYGTEAMQLVLRFAFRELNLKRVSLTVFGYNPRAVRSYEKAGFREEGRARGYLNRGGRRWDMIYMGILRREWEARQSGML